MGLTGWLKRRSSDEARQRREWREAWAASIEAGDTGRLDELRARLDTIGANGDDVEMELEMLDALERMVDLRAEAAAGALPVVETQHRVIGAERCHFTAPASLPSDASQSSGRVLFTRTRGLFVGGGATVTLPWHLVQHIVRTDRDVILARVGGAGGAHFRFNNYADAVAAAFLARRLKEARSSGVL